MPLGLFAFLCVVGFLLVWYVIGLSLLPWFTKYEAMIHAEPGKCLEIRCNLTERVSYYHRGEQMYKSVPLQGLDYENLRNICVLESAKWDAVWWFFKLLSVWPTLLSAKTLSKHDSDTKRLKVLEEEKALEKERVNKYVEELREEQAKEFARLELGK